MAKDLNNVDLPNCISESDHMEAVLEALKGNTRAFLNRWLAACDTLNILAGYISVSGFFHSQLPNADTLKEIEASVNNKNLKLGYDHWVAAGRTIDMYNSIIFPSNPVQPQQPQQPLQPQPNQQFSSKKINFFLWKPVSEGGGFPYQGCPVLLSKGSENVGFKVNGVIGKFMGPNNGYQSADRFSTKAANMPVNTVVEFFDRDTNLPVLFGGKSSLVIPNPVRRYECVPTGIKEIVV